MPTPCHDDRRLLHLACALLACACCLLPRPARAEYRANRLNLLISANQVRGNNNDDWSYAGSLDAQSTWLNRKSQVELTLDSDYTRSETAITDHLLTNLRWIGVRDPNAAGWRPVFLSQTEGTHDFDTATLLLAAGLRRAFNGGFVEFTAGSSRGIGKADEWVGDAGLAFAYERTFNQRWKIKTGPQAQYGTMGQVRLRDHRLRYSWDLNLDYQLNSKYSIGYRLWKGNTVANSEQTQWFGLRMKIK